MKSPHQNWKKTEVGTTKLTIRYLRILRKHHKQSEQLRVKRTWSQSSGISAVDNRESWMSFQSLIVWGKKLHLYASKLQCLGVTISTTHSLWDKVICRHSGFTLQIFVDSRPPFLERFPFDLFKNASHTSSVESIIPKSSGTILYLLQFLLETFSMRIPNRTSIFQAWAYQSFISCCFNILGAKKK